MFIQTSRFKEEIRRTICENPSLTPTQIQSNIIVSKTRQEGDCGHKSKQE